ncbi:gamma-glutamyltransferase [Mesorhizobium sp. WSM3866]|uniref:gamma-glutamyltransferase family protein n=1 Tax=Mesorhizobium sp. WSM3866 TaxID=422271 RepID=UPI000BAEB8D2|nr:gamma-glutamyltransferase family protein [Mesorhizobium sp. WSM3866]PBB40018.1 gamma-glutamyltransferase [Mesorhizobium sp. WSM3866]
MAKGKLREVVKRPLDVRYLTALGWRWLPVCRQARAVTLPAGGFQTNGIPAIAYEALVITSRPEIVGTFGVVTSTHWLASTVGMSILERGGNAFDAAVATGCVLHIVEPNENGPGGDVPIVLWSVAKKRVDVICGQGVAPAAVNASKLRKMGFDIIPGAGHLPAVVPGSFGAWMLLLRDYGTMRPRDVLAPAIAIARNGFVTSPEIASVLNDLSDFFREYWPSSAEVFLPGGRAPRVGTLLCLPAQAETYERIVRECETAGSDREAQIEAARRSWYEGFVAEAIDQFFRQPVMDTSGEAHAGFLTAEDLSRWRATVETPLTIDYKQYRMCKPGPWAQSPVMLQQLALLTGFDIAGMDPLGAEFVHTVQECAKLAFADRDAFYGDPKFADVPIDRLLSGEYNEERRQLVGGEASQELRPGRIDGYGGRIPLRSAGSTNIAHSEIDFARKRDAAKAPSWASFLAESHGDTCHFDIIDRWGNMISATPSGGWMSGSPVVPGLGFCVSVRGQMFLLDERHPNALAPGKRPRTTLTPSLALRDGEPYLAFGTPGGDSQDQWALHAFLRHVDHGMNLQEAVDAPSFHSAHLPSSFYPREWMPGHLAVEAGFPRQTLAELNRRGHQLEIFGRWEHYNSVTMAARDGDVVRASASPRRMKCYAIGR